MARRDWYCEDVLPEKIAVERVYEDDRVLAFRSPQPMAPIHVLVIPKEHVESILDPKALDRDLLNSMVRGVQEAARVHDFAGKGFFVRTNVRGEDVTPHMHWHVLGPGIPPLTGRP
ncbi:MAG TPA: HIT domain-containing protein [Thermoplasmata archaeon]|jgi:histidine triad (HIT) family protein